ncbi:hypothetical protein F2P79_019086 [Pimephales promelas]|nr:hypothetical protein F2P79_019086 [Pimephales promelas]
MPGPTGTQSHELIPGYVTSLSCEFVSVSTGPADRKREWQRDSQQSPDDGRPSTSSQDSRRAKAKAEEEEKKLHSRDWSGIIPDQRTAPIPERRAEGICAFLRRIGKAVKLDCSEVDILVSTYPSCNPTDVQQDSSEFYWATPVHPCPSGVQLPVNADPDDPEHSCTSVLDPEPAVARDLELMSFSGLSSLSSIELTPDSIQDDPDDASSVPDFAESQTQKKKKDVGAFLRRKWRAMIAPAVVSALGCYGDDTVDPDPADLQPPISVLSRDLTEPGPSHREISSDQLPFSGPSHREISLDTSPFSRTDEEIDNLIRLRMELDSDFTGKRNSAKKAWIKVLQRIGLEGKVAPNQISKKWDNLKRKYKELRCPPTGTGTDSGEATAATWQWFSAMHEAIGGRPSIEPPILIDSCDAEVTRCSIVSKDPGSPPSAFVEEREEEENTTSSAMPGTGNFQEERPCTSSGPPSPKKKRSNRVLDFLEKETEKEEERFQATYELMQSTSTRFLDLFEQLIKKS